MLAWLAITRQHALSQEKSAPLFEENLERSSSKVRFAKHTTCEATSSGAKDASRHVCQLRVSATRLRIARNSSPTFTDAWKNVCIDYYLNSIDETGWRQRMGPREPRVEPLSRARTASRTRVRAARAAPRDTPSCRLYALFAKPGSLDLCRKYYLHSLGDYFKTETDGSYKFKIGSNKRWLCGKGVSVSPSTHLRTLRRGGSRQTQREL